jgi:simple sugar transport system substrate-binding protein
MSRIGRPLKALAAVGALTLTAAACSSEGGAQDAGPGGGEEYTIAMVTHEAPGDTFWDKIRNGAEAAADKHGITLNYSQDPDAGRQATLIQNAIDSEVDGLAVTLPTPDAIGPTVQDAVDAGIPVAAFNAGKDQYQQFGASMYFGSDEDIAGQAVGTQLTESGSTGKAICVIQEQGQVQLETRCAGVAKTYPNSEVLYVNGRDLPSVQQTIAAKLQQDPSVTGVVTLGADIALAAQQAKSDSGSQATIATFDLNQDVAEAIQSGDIAFSVDQQPFVQGYLAVLVVDAVGLAGGAGLG